MTTSAPTTSPVAQFHWLPHTWGIAFGITAALLYPQSPLLTCAIMGWSVYVFMRENEMFERSFIQAQRGVILTHDGMKAASITANQVQKILVEQSIAGRIFNFGSIVFVDKAGRRKSIGPVRSPHQFRKSLILSV